MIPSMRRGVRHVMALVLFAGLTLAWLWPVLSDPGHLIPGSGAGDNLTFVWNGWWMRHALSAHTSPFHTTMMFAPWGADLTLNTHTALAALVAALLSRVTSILAATNCVIALHLFLNFAVTYALAWRLTGCVSRVDHRLARGRLVAVRRLAPGGTLQPDCRVGAAADGAPAARHA